MLTLVSLVSGLALVLEWLACVAYVLRWVSSQLIIMGIDIAGALN